MFLSRRKPAPATYDNTALKSILDWLAQAHASNDLADSGQLHAQIIKLREASPPGEQRIKLLDLLFAQAERIVNAELPSLRESTLPISRKLRLRVRALLELLEDLTQDYFNSLAGLFDPQGSKLPGKPNAPLRRAMHALAWQISISQLVAAPPNRGVWQKAHAAFRTARRLGIEKTPGPNGMPSIERIYLDMLLGAIAQPASFSPIELDFIRHYVENQATAPALQETPPADPASAFWIDPEIDFPAHALVRRAPPAGVRVLYFSCGHAAGNALKNREELLKGRPASQLGLSPLADTHTGQGALLRLSELWGHPLKRKFPRRRQSYRAKICPGLKNLWQLTRNQPAEIEFSEWMVTNESPDGYSVMHVSGHAANLRVGDMLALRAAKDGTSRPASTWQICLVRWAVSENPEHIELGLELVSARAVALEISRPGNPSSPSLPALILPKAPPLRPHQSLVLPGGQLKERTCQISVTPALDGQQTLTVQLEEQTSSVDFFKILSGNSP